MSKKLSKKTRIIYNKIYYKLVAALWSQKMQLLLDAYHKKLKDLGIATPSRFFKTAKEYHDWAIKAHSRGIYYEGLVDDIIEEFGFSETIEKYRLGFWWYVYFGVSSPPITSTHGRSIEVSSDKSHVVVKIKIFPWTIKEDVLQDTELWAQVEKRKQVLVIDKKKERNTAWRTLERDLKIYELQLNRKKQNQKTTPQALIKADEFREIEQSYSIPDSIEYTISQIIKKCEAKFKGITLI